MKMLQVGGCVRDALLGRVVHDRDWLVVGGTPELMLALGFRPVGKDFPVFLHPDTHEEYALARTERKAGRGHGGFHFYSAPDVSIEDDLIRRDLTINAMALETLADGQQTLIDPYGGQRDLAAKVLRHVSPAFAEDPLRVFRVARFAARFPAFHLAEETQTLMAAMSASGELTSLSVERVWVEIQRGLTEPAPRRMFEVLASCGALAVFLPELAALQGVPQNPLTHPEGDAWTHTMLVMDAVAAQTADPLTRFAALTHDLGKSATDSNDLPHHPHHDVLGEPLARALAKRLRAPNDYQNMASLCARWHETLYRLYDDPTQINLWWALFQGVDAFRRPESWARLLHVLMADHSTHTDCAAKGAAPFPAFIAQAQQLFTAISRPIPPTLPLEQRPHSAESRAAFYQQRIQEGLAIFLRS